MIYTSAWLASLASVYVAVFAVPLVLGSWVVLQHTRTLMAGLWLGLLLTLLAGALALGAIGLYLLESIP